MEMIPESQNTVSQAENNAGAGNIGGANATYNLRLQPDELVQLVRGSGGHIQEVHVTDEDGNVEIAYSYAPNDGNQISTLVSAAELTTSKQDDPSFEFYDNARGKINLNILSKLVAKHGLNNESKNASKWSQVTSEYNALTDQDKSRSVLMKRWASVKSSRKEALKAKDAQQTDEDQEGAIKKSVLIKQLKTYDALRIEAAQFERDAKKLEMENALLEQESLQKENAILDVQLEAAKLELALIQGSLK